MEAATGRPRPAPPTCGSGGAYVPRFSFHERTTRTGRPRRHEMRSAWFMLSNTCIGGRGSSRARVSKEVG